MNNLWVWLLVGLIPYSIDVQREKEKRTVEVRAVFLSLVVLVQDNGSYQWKVNIHLIEQLRK